MRATVELDVDDDDEVDNLRLAAAEALSRYCREPRELLSPRLGAQLLICLSYRLRRSSSVFSSAKMLPFVFKVTSSSGICNENLSHSRQICELLHITCYFRQSDFSVPAVDGNSQSHVHTKTRT